jgi:NAD(P)-dependent dehydrogenase (short-subunit alcohol dehydrogenase family)
VLARFPADWWALILGGSSGFGLAAAQRLAAQGMGIAIVHRDRRGAMPRIEPEFEKLRGHGVPVRTWNADALDPTARDTILAELTEVLGPEGRVRVLLHSIAFGNLKPLAPDPRPRGGALRALAQVLGVPEPALAAHVGTLFEQGHDELLALAPEPAARPTQPSGSSGRALLDEEDFARTIHAMGTSLLGWTRGLLQRSLFTPDARVLGLTSEGNAVSWRGYAAVSAAKVALESLCRSLAVELAPHGVRTNVLQPGITDTPALRAIPGADRLRASARLRNPFRRLTTPDDVAAVVALLASDEAAWINGTVLRVDGGEHVSGAAW